MALKKFDAYMAKQKLEVDGEVIPANSHLLCIGVIGGSNSQVIKRDTPIDRPLTLKARHMRHLASVPLNTPEPAKLYNRYIIESQGRRPLRNGPFREGEVLEATDRIQLSDGGCIPKRHRVLCTHADAAHATFTFSHALEYVDDTLTLPHKDAAYVLAPTAEHDEKAALEATSGMRLEIPLIYHDEQGKLDAWMALMKGPFGSSLRVVRRPDAEPFVDGDSTQIATVANCLRRHACSPHLSYASRTEDEREAVLSENDAAVIIQYAEYRLSWKARVTSFHEHVLNETSIAWRNEMLRYRAALA